MKKVLVTGANGFVGRALCKRMAAEGWQVRAVVRDLSRSIGTLDGMDCIQMGDIGPKTDWSQALVDVDIIIHLAARTHVMNDTVAEPLSEYRVVNVAGTERLANMASKMGVRRLIFASTIKVNGEETSNRPFTEKDTPSPQGAYGFSKLEAEEVLKRIGKETGLEIVIIRAPLMYGPHVKGNFLKLMDLINRGYPFPLGSIRNQRSLIGIENMIDALILCAKHPKAAGEIFLVADGEDFSTPKLVRHLATALGRPSRILQFPVGLIRTAAKILGKRDLADRLCDSLQVDNGKIRRLLGFCPHVSTGAGLKQMAEWYLTKDLR